MQPRHFFIKMLGQNIDVIVILIAFTPQLDLRQNLVCKRSRHHKGRMACGIAKVQKAAFGQQYQTVAIWHFDHIDLIFDVGPFVVFKMGHLNFIIEMADISHDGHIFHTAHMFDADNIFVASGGDKDIRCVQLVFKQHHLKAVHRRLQSTDRINFGNFHARTRAAQ